MALTKEDLQSIANLIQPVKDDMHELKKDVQELKEGVQGTKEEVQGLKEDIQELNRRITSIEMTLENETNRNIQLLAENHINLIDKLNQSLKVADKNLVFEVQMTGLRSSIDALEKEIIDIKKRTA